MELLGVNGDTRTWVSKDKEADAIADAHKAMLTKLADINARAQDAARPIQEETDALVAESLDRHLAEATKLRAACEERVHGAVAALKAEAERASEDFHALVWGLNPEMSRKYLPMINLNQHEAGSGIVVIAERK